MAIVPIIRNNMTSKDGTITIVPYGEPFQNQIEAERIGRDPSVKRYYDVEEALRELKS